MVKVSIGWVRELESAHADVVKSLTSVSVLIISWTESLTNFIVDAKCLIRVLNQLMYGECCVVWLNNCVRDLR